MFTDLRPSNALPAAVPAQREPKNRLARHVMSAYQRNSTFRTSSGAEKNIEDAVRLYNLVPSAADSAMFQRMGVLPETFDPIVRSKVNAIIALLTRVFVNQGKTWSVEPTPRPEVPESVTASVYAKVFEEFFALLQAQGRMPTPEEAAEYAFRRSGDILNAQKAWASVRAERMDVLVDDLMTEGGFAEAEREVITQMVKTGTGVAVGPCETVEYGLVQSTGDSLGDVTFERRLKRVMRFFVPDTLDVFPSPGAKRVGDGDLCVRVRYSLSDLALYAKMSVGAGEKKGRTPDGWDAEAVKRVVARIVAADGKMPELSLPIDWLIDAVASDSNSSGQRQKAEAVRYFGTLQGDMLASGGVEKDGEGKALSPDVWYEADVTVLDGEVICAKVCDPAIGRPVTKCVCYADPSSWFGGSFAFMLRNVQALMNVLVASLKKQMQMAAGPMLVFNDYENFVGAENPSTFNPTPWKTLFRKVDPMSPSANSKAVETVDFETRTSEILKVIEALYQMADELTGFPRLMFGSGAMGGALRTASGMSMAQEAANIHASWIIGNIDSQFVRPSIQKLVTWVNMRYPDASVKGDVSIVAHGALGQVLETARRTEAMNLYAMVSRDPFLVQNMGPSKVLAMFRSVLETMKIKDPDRYVPSPERLEELDMINRISMLSQAVQQPGGQPQQAGGGGQGAETGMAAFESGGQTGQQAPAAPPGGEAPDTSDVKRRRSAA